MKEGKKVGVIGSGLAGLAAACTAAARGHRVTLFEANDWLGGKAAQRWGEGPNGERFRFDMGPTILTVPNVLRRVFEENGKEMGDYLDLVRLDPQWRCFFDDDAGGGVLDLREKVEDMQQTLREFGNGHGGEMAERYGAFIKYTERLHKISDDFFFWKPVGGLRDIFELGNTFNYQTLGDVLSMRMGRSVASTIRKYTPDKRVAQMLDHFTQYVGSSPYGSPAILCSIASMQVNDGVWYPIGGTRAVPEALVKLGGEIGVEFRTNAAVARINEAGGQVKGVTLASGEEVELDAVISNMDSVRTRHELLNGDDRGGLRGGGDPEPACSGVVLYLGLDREYEHLAHHDFVFSRDPEEEFDYIYKKGEPAPDPTAYLAATARTEAPGLVAPEGGEALYVLVHTPYLRPHHDWSKDGELFTSYRNTILDKLERTAGLEGIRERIVYESALTPQDIHDRYRVLNGAIYGLASHGKFLGAFKPSNRSPLAKGLYLAGGAAHPGPGMPMVLMSGWIAADALDQDVAGTAVA
ncbi:MAG: phytoene desaturase family protein [Planctomycetota bacterium]